ncbi:hypothetical protein FDG2_0030 [Candidatus Protofrankia californiensis]|uniref:Replication initiator protein n=1 Tax=Candidatus Protofrankia californiensis TaxID=1839754 RepID=A0A1C3NSW3_9ACTN|nr:hypothetical protein FDG2_0030 [Candidatus Protofrankia californiensis]
MDLAYRRMARMEGISERACRTAVRISYVKVAEGQARGAVHFHALLRLDDATTPDGVWAPPPGWASGKLLADCWRWAVTHAEQPCPNPRAAICPRTLTRCPRSSTVACSGRNTVQHRWTRSRR